MKPDAGVDGAKTKQARRKSSDIAPTGHFAGNAISTRRSFAVAARMAAYLLAVMLVFGCIFVLCTLRVSTAPSPSSGVIDLTGIDFTEEIATVRNTNFLMYPGAFYMPEDFAQGNVSQQGISYGMGEAKLGEWGTLRVLLQLPPGEAYAIAGKNVSYAQRLFIDGKEHAAIGVPADSADKVTPKTTRFATGFQPEGDTTEIIIHYAAFVYADGGGLYSFVIGLVQNVVRYEQLKVFRITAVTVALVTAALFFFGLFLFFAKASYFLWFALVCLCVALHGLLTSDKYIMLLLPNLNWYLAIRLEFTMNCGMAIFSMLYINSLFPSVAHRWVVRGLLAFFASNLLLIYLVPPVVFSHYATLFVGTYAGLVSCLLLAVLRAALRKKLTSPLSGTEQILLLCALVVYMICSVTGIYAHQSAIYLWGLDYPQVGTMAFLFINVMALVLGFARTESERDEAYRRERELHEQNKLLDRVNRMKSDLVATVAHETRTPLAVLSGYAELISGDMRRRGVDEQTAADLDRIADETQRIARIMEEAQRLSRAKDNAAHKAQIQLIDIIRPIARLYAPILERKQTRLTVRLPDELPTVFANAEEITQVLFNLLSNAEKHTENGEVVLSAASDGGFMAVCVADSGTGIRPGFLPRVFERHMHDDAEGTGLGLPICKEIIEAHGGEISIESTLKKGTAVTFILPLHSKEVTDDGQTKNDSVS